MRNFYIMGIALLMGTALCQADDTSNLIVTSKNGVTTEFDLTKIGKVTFSDNNLEVLMADGSKETLDIMDMEHGPFTILWVARNINTLPSNSKRTV